QTLHNAFVFASLRTRPLDPTIIYQSKCFQNYLDFHRCNNALAAKDQDISPCQWYQSLVPGLVGKWDEKIEQGTFPGKI
uniref:Uncharacterized protein n=1 Tax=Cynoglossus semilaevis TaxID=244447 RepID=A0A3P8W7F7_CYNSE